MTSTEQFKVGVELNCGVEIGFLVEGASTRLNWPSTVP